MSSTPTPGLARMRRVPRRSTDSTDSSASEKTTVASTVASIPSSVPQIVQASVRSIPQTDFIHTLSSAAATATAGQEPANNTNNLPLSTGGRLTILAMNKELSIRPVEPATPANKTSSSDNDVQFVRCARAVSTQTPETEASKKHRLEENGEQTPPKRTRVSSLVDYGGHPDLLKRIVQIKEERLVIEKEKLKTLRQLVACLRGANGSSSLLATVLGEKEPPK